MPTTSPQFVNTIADLRDDFWLMDGLEKVVHGSRRAAGSPYVDTNVHALPLAINSKEMATSNGVYRASDTVWHIPTREFVVTTKPKPGDTVTEWDGTVWTVLEVGHHALTGNWRCVARNLTVAYDLSQRITIETCGTVENGIGKDVAAAMTQSWRDRYVNIPARMQPIQDELVTDQLQRGAQRRYTVFVDRELDVRNDAGFDRIRFDGVLYAITGYRNAERIDMLPEIDALLEI